MDPRTNTPIKAPEYVEWPDHGVAKVQQPRGMSDYARGAESPYSANYITEDGRLLKFRDGVRWKAEYRGHTTKWKTTAEDAIQDLEKRIQNRIQVQQDLKAILDIEEPSREEFVQALKDSMKFFNMTSDAVRNKLMVARSSIDRWCSGKNCPLPVMRRPIMRFFQEKMNRYLDKAKPNH